MVEKELSEFSLSRKRKDGYQTQCRACQREYRKANADRARETAKQWRKDNRDQYLENKRDYRKENGWRWREAEKARSKRWQKENRKEITARLRQKRKDDPIYGLMLTLRTRLSDYFRGPGKSETARELVGCSLEELKKYLESKFLPGMTWQNRGFYGWHIDHIKPMSSFDLLDPEQQKKCFNYTNLQPLWAFDNLSKGDKIL